MPNWYARASADWPSELPWFDPILRHAAARLVQRTEIFLAARVPHLRALAVPAGSLGHVAGHALAVLVLPARLHRGLAIAGIGRLHEQAVGARLVAGRVDLDRALEGVLGRLGRPGDEGPHDYQ
jgi:hypothetical protein